MPDTREMMEQHRELIALCRNLDEAVKLRRERCEIYRIMDQLIACTARHFEAEEQLMAEAGYPELEGHKARHKELLERTCKFRKRLNLYGEKDFTEWFNHWPFPFILAHIQNGDHQIVEHIGRNTAAKPGRQVLPSPTDSARAAPKGKPVVAVGLACPARATSARPPPPRAAP